MIFDDTKQTSENLAAAVDKLGFKASVKAVEAPVNALPFNGHWAPRGAMITAATSQRASNPD